VAAVSAIRSRRAARNPWLRPTACTRSGSGRKRGGRCARRCLRRSSQRARRRWRSSRSASWPRSRSASRAADIGRNATGRGVGRSFARDHPHSRYLGQPEVEHAVSSATTHPVGTDDRCRMRVVHIVYRELLTTGGPVLPKMPPLAARRRSEWRQTTDFVRRLPDFGMTKSLERLVLLRRWLGVHLKWG
jgi:hypothetical protein